MSIKNLSYVVYGALFSVVISSFFLLGKGLPQCESCKAVACACSI